MQIGNFVITGENCFALANNYITEYYTIDYQKLLTEGLLYCAEDHSFTSGGSLLIVITIARVNRSNNECEIEIIAGGGSRGIFSINTGNEERRVEKFYAAFVEFCDPLGYDISKLEER